MFITVSIYSKNLNSLTNFLKFFYKLQMNQLFRLKLFTVQSQKKKKTSFFSVLKSPHVNKKAQEQFEFYTHSKQLKIHVSKLNQFLTICKIIKTKLFFDVKIETKFVLSNKLFKYNLFDKTNSDRFLLKFTQNKNFHFSNVMGQTSLRLLDFYGEVLLKNLFKSLDSSVGRAKD